MSAEGLMTRPRAVLSLVSFRKQCAAHCPVEQAGRRAREEDGRVRTVPHLVRRGRALASTLRGDLGVHGQPIAFFLAVTTPSNQAPHVTDEDGENGKESRGGLVSHPRRTSKQRL